MPNEKNMLLFHFTIKETRNENTIEFKLIIRFPSSSHLSLPGLDLDGRDLVPEDALVGGRLPRLLRPERERVYLLPAQVVLDGQVLGRHAHRQAGQRVRQRRPHHVLQLRVGAELRAEPGRTGGKDIEIVGFLDEMCSFFTTRE